MLLKIKNLRVLITNRCPYNCSYCHREGMDGVKNEALNITDYEYLAKLLKNNFGLEKVSFSGGDPCCRTDLWQIINKVNKLGLSSIIVTKGQLLKTIGKVSQIHFSIDTLNNILYSKITGVKSNVLEKTISKVLEAKSRGVQVFINTVILKGVNDNKQNFKTLLAFCKKHQIDEWRLIEEMGGLPFRRRNVYLEKYANKMGLKVANQLPGHKLTLRHNNIPITLYRCHCVAIWLTKKYIPESLFLDPEGQILLCMHNNMKVDLLDAIKKRKTTAIIKLIKYLDFKAICPALKLR